MGIRFRSMVTDHDIARWRLRSQLLVRPYAATGTDAVGNLLAVQAENPSQSAWAVASRTVDPSHDELRAALVDGRLIRTHVLRPTWHYVLAEDIGWLLELTAPRVRQVTRRQLDAAHGLDDRQIESHAAAVADILQRQPDLTRAQIAEALGGRGFVTSGGLMTILLAHLELESLICSGRPNEDEHTYALFADRVHEPRRRDRDD